MTRPRPQKLRTHQRDGGAPTGRCRGPGIAGTGPLQNGTTDRRNRSGAEGGRGGGRQGEGRGKDDEKTAT
eukprot:4208736-Pyramimonas_sp.AAC.1